MAQQALRPRSHEGPETSTRREFNAKTAGILAGIGLGLVGASFAGKELLSGGAKSGSQDQDQAPSNTDTMPAPAGASYNGLEQDPKLYENRLNPADYINMTEAQIAEVMTLPIEGLEDDMTAAIEWVRRWELFTNFACVPQEVESAIQNAGYTLTGGEGSQKSIRKNFAEYRDEKYGSTIDYVTNTSYGQDFLNNGGLAERDKAVALIEEYAGITAHNFGNQISTPAGTYGATANVTTRIAVDSVKVSSSDLPADRRLEIGVTMTYDGPYRDEIRTGVIELLLNEAGDNYIPTVSALHLKDPAPAL